MKKFVFFVLFCTVCLCVSASAFMSGNDNEIRKSCGVHDGHEYYLYESGDSGSEDYCFSLEHRVDCKKCIGELHAESAERELQGSELSRKFKVRKKTNEEGHQFIEFSCGDGKMFRFFIEHRVDCKTCYEMFD